jgi:beta-glucosidase
MTRDVLGFAVLTAMVLTRWGAAPTLAQDAGDALDAKVEATLKVMTLDEMVGQMTQADLNAIPDKSAIATYFLGSVLSGGNSDPPDITPKGWAQAHDECQEWALKARLKLPIIYGIDAVHGHNNVDGAVIFPHNIGLGATRNPGLVEKAARVTALEMVGTGIRWAFAPCIAVARDERWGRTYESFGETPELAEMMGAAAVRGLQGERLSDPTSVLACAKHFLGDGGTTGGKDQGNTECDEATLRTVHLPGYAAAIRAGVGSIMVSYSSFHGVKMHANAHLLTDVLKGELGFKGFLVSDWAAIDQISPDFKTDIETSINAGLDMVMIPNKPGQKNNYVEFNTLLKELVAEGKVPRDRIDDSVRRILRIKYAMDLSGHPFSNPSLMAQIGCAEHRQVARQCVRESLVLLKNERHALPLAKTLKRLHVAGKAADDIGVQCGGWTIEWQGKKGAVTHGGTTILEAVRHAGPNARVTFDADGSGAAGADAVLVVVGEPPYAEMMGDRKDLGLLAEDLAIVRKARETGAPVVTVLISGRPVILGSALSDSDALVAAWLPGTEGQGVADVLFGEQAPTGKLPHTWPRSMEQVPTNAGDPSASEAQFPYGFGLTY